MIGGSLALAARQRGLCTNLTLWSQFTAEREEATAVDGLADHVTGDLVAAVRGADLVLLCTPPASLPTLAAKIAPHLAPGAIVSDVGSVKGVLVEELTAVFVAVPPAGGSRYVGGHPMAGAETGGFRAARGDLFADRVCLLTPLPGRTTPEAVDLVTRFWRALGARVRCLDPQAHDEAVALVSHLPHVLAAGLASYVGAQPGSPRECAGPGWRDMTRLAGGNPEMWTEILSRNRVPVTTALRGTLAKLGEVLEILEAGRDADLTQFLDAARHHRESGPF